MSPADDDRQAQLEQAAAPAEQSRNRLSAVTLDQTSIGHGNHHIEHEREVAIFDLIDGNSFAVVGRSDGPYTLHLGIEDDRLVMTVGTPSDAAVLVHPLALSTFRRIVRDYFTVCDTYYEAIRTAPPSRIQAIDTSRRAIHDDAGRLLMDRLSEKMIVDFDTARRLFTLIAALHWKG